MRNVLKLIASFMLAASVAACGGGSSSSSNSGSSSVTALQVTDTVVGTGAIATVGSAISVNYTGWLYDASAPNFEGAEFDSSANAGKPYQFVLGAGKVIPGWDQGLVGMKVGGSRTLIIPSSLAYGASGHGAIPPNAALVFTVTLVSMP